MLTKNEQIVKLLTENERSIRGLVRPYADDHCYVLVSKSTFNEFREELMDLEPFELKRLKNNVQLRYNEEK